MILSRALRLLLERLLGPGDAHHLGDLDEEFARRFPAPSFHAELWYFREVGSLVAARLRNGPPPSSGTSLRRSSMIDSIRSELQLAVRRLRRAPMVPAVIVGTLGVTLSVVLVMFAVVDVAFLRPLPYHDADRLVRLHTGFDGGSSSVDAISPLNLRGVEEANAVIEGAGAWSMGETVLRTDGRDPVRVDAPRASVSLLPVLGLTPERGRWFVEEEGVPGQDRAVVLSHGYWTRAYGADPEAVGRSIELDGAEYRIVGVAPASGMVPRDADMWRALALGPEWYDQDRWGWQFLGAVARLRPGIDVDVAKTELDRGIVATSSRAAENGQVQVLESLRGDLVGEVRSGLLILAAAVLLLLAMACLNIVGVLVARAETRRREFGMRRALGAGGTSLVRLVAAETVVMSVLGAALGFGLATAGLALLERSEIDAIARLSALGPLTIDHRVVLTALALLTGVTAVFGTAPLVTALGIQPAGALGGFSTRGSTVRASRLRGVLVVAQIGLTKVLLLSVATATGAYRATTSGELGFRPQGVVALGVELPAGVSRDEAFAFYRDAPELLTEISGVEAVGGVQTLPLEGIGWSASFTIESPDRPDQRPGANMRPTVPGYFQAVGIPVVEGRVFDERDVDGATPAVVIDEAVAEIYFPDGSPVGRQVEVGGLSRETATVIGVVGNVPDRRPDVLDTGHLYFSLLQRAQRDVHFVVRTDRDPGQIAEVAKERFRGLPLRIALTRAFPLSVAVADSMAGPRLGLVLLSVVGGAALLLAVVGLYGVLAFAVSRRTREIGTRIALGADPARIVRSVVRQAGRYWGTGILGGAVLALFARDGLARLVLEFEQVGLWVWLVAPVVLGLATLTAAAVPAARAVRVDPNEALRAE